MFNKLQKQKFPTPTTGAELRLLDPYSKQYAEARKGKRALAAAALVLAVSGVAEFESGNEPLRDAGLVQVAAAGALGSGARKQGKEQHEALRLANQQLGEHRAMPFEERLVRAGLDPAKAEQIATQYSIPQNPKE